MCFAQCFVIGGAVLEGKGFVDWALGGTAVLFVMLAVYTHMEGNRWTALRFVYDDIRRDMGKSSRHRVMWRAFRIVMGWQKRPLADRHSNVVPIAPVKTHKTT